MQLAEPIPIDKLPAETYWGADLDPPATTSWGGQLWLAKRTYGDA
jgi:hypothetical protein